MPLAGFGGKYWEGKGGKEGRRKRLASGVPPKTNPGYAYECVLVAYLSYDQHWWVM